MLQVQRQGSRRDLASLKKSEMNWWWRWKGVVAPVQPQRRAEGILTLLAASVANAVKLSWGGLWEAVGVLHRS